MKISVTMLSAWCTLSVRQQTTRAFQSSLPNNSRQRLLDTACNRRIKPCLFWGETDNNFSTDSSQNQDRKFRSRGAPVEDNNGGGWDDFDDERRSNEPVKYNKGKSSTKNRRGQSGNYRPARSSSNRDNNNFRSSGGGRQFDRGGNTRRQRGNFDSRSHERKEADENKINMKALEEAGFQHLYGLAPVLNALSADRRSFTNDSDEDDYYERKNMIDDDIKPTAQLKPGLFIQDSKRQQQGSGKADAIEEIMRLAEEKQIRTSYVDKGQLNTLCGNRPHQGFVLRCGGLEFKQLDRLPSPSELGAKLWLVLDEVVDPQNFGALLRSAYFLGGRYSSDDDRSIGVLVCKKNSAPLSPIVSASSSGALELSTVYSTNNLPRTLNAAREEGWRIMGAAAEAPTDMFGETGEPVVCHDLEDVTEQKPTLLVLGSEGHGLRNLVARACTDFVRIPGCDTSDERNGESSSVGVDSLNVSVTGGILLWHLKSIATVQF